MAFSISSFNEIERLCDNQDFFQLSWVGTSIHVRIQNMLVFPDGWSQWDNWSACPVTCGTAQRARRRICLDDKKDEFKGNLGIKSTCKGIGRETQRYSGVPLEGPFHSR